MNPAELFDYGIQTEQSDIRAHVAVAARRVLVFQTRAILEMLKTKNHKEATATQPGVNFITARGFLIPVGDVPDIRALNFASYTWEAFPGHADTTSAKGKAAVDVVCELLQIGRFPLWIEAKESDKTNLQISGTDIIVYSKQKIQVKCDWFAGKKEWNPLCTGNLFIQTAERNPLKNI